MICSACADKGETKSMDKKTTTSAGIGFGSALAISISWSLHHSILWAMLHGFFSWFYVIYFAINRVD